MTDEDIRRIVEDAGAYDESREGTLLGMLGDFYGRQMRSMAILVWANGLVALAIAGASAVLFFQTDEIKQEILYAATFLTGVVWLAIIKVFAWLAINRTSISREIKPLEIRLAEACKILQQPRP